jgi:hypothetical protein
VGEWWSKAPSPVLGAGVVVVVAAPEAAGLPAPVASTKRVSSVPVSAVVTKPPMLGLAMCRHVDRITGDEDTKLEEHRRALRGVDVQTVGIGSDPLTLSSIVRRDHRVPRPAT